MRENGTEPGGRRPASEPLRACVAHHASRARRCGSGAPARGSEDQPRAGRGARVLQARGRGQGGGRLGARCPLRGRRRPVPPGRTARRGRGASLPGTASAPVAGRAGRFAGGGVAGRVGGAAGGCDLVAGALPAGALVVLRPADRRDPRPAARRPALHWLVDLARLPGAWSPPARGAPRRQSQWRVGQVAQRAHGAGGRLGARLLRPLYGGAPGLPGGRWLRFRVRQLVPCPARCADDRLGGPAGYAGPVPAGGAGPASPPAHAPPLIRQRDGRRWRANRTSSRSFWATGRSPPRSTMCTRAGLGCAAPSRRSRKSPRSAAYDGRKAVPGERWQG